MEMNRAVGISHSDITIKNSNTLKLRMAEYVEYCTSNNKATSVHRRQ